MPSQSQTWLLPRQPLPLGYGVVKIRYERRRAAMNGYRELSDTRSWILVKASWTKDYPIYRSIPRREGCWVLLPKHIPLGYSRFKIKLRSPYSSLYCIMGVVCISSDDPGVIVYDSRGWIWH